MIISVLSGVACLLVCMYIGLGGGGEAMCAFVVVVACLLLGGWMDDVVLSHSSRRGLAADSQQTKLVFRPVQLYVTSRCLLTEVQEVTAGLPLKDQLFILN